MLETFDRSLFQAMKASADLAGVAMNASRSIADLVIFAAPAILVLLWMFGSRGDRRAAVGAAFAATAGLTTSAIVSALYFHPRPFMDGVSPNFLHHVADSSFPSDHATVLFALAFSLWLARLRATRWAGAILLMAALAVGWARVFLGAHYPLDILGGAGIGFAFAAIFAINPLRRGVERFSDLADRAYFALGAALVRRAR